MRSSGLVLFTCAGLLLSGGAILGGSTAWSLLRMSYYFWTTDLGVEMSSSVLFLTGALLCLPACWLCTIIPYHTKSHSLVGILLMLVTAAMLTLSLGLSSVSALSRVVREPSAMNASMLRAMACESIDPAVRSSWTSMQIELRCCGVQSYKDWYVHRRALPPSCCGRIWNGKRGDSCEIPLHSVGCLGPALMELRSFVNALCTLGASMVIVLGMTLFTVAYIVVTGAVDHRENPKPLPQPLRIACLTHPPLGAPALASMVSYNAPALEPFSACPPQGPITAPALGTALLANLPSTFTK